MVFILGVLLSFCKAKKHQLLFQALPDYLQLTPPDGDLVRILTDDV